MEEGQKIRYPLLDILRGLCLLSMIGYHAAYDVVHIAGVPLPWLHDTPGDVWQQSICWTFILLSGLCWNLSRHPLKHGLILTGCGAAITLITYLVMPTELIQYGVLTLLGLSSLLLIPLRKLLRKTGIPAWAGALGAFLLFLLLKGVPRGYLGFGGGKLFELPALLYRSDVPALLGFHSAGFFSADYFPLIPWFFLYLTGYFLWGMLSSSERVEALLQGPKHSALRACARPIAFLGRHSLLIYLVHQPALLGIFLLLSLSLS